MGEYGDPNSKYFAKRWDPVFFENCRMVEDVPFVEVMQRDSGIERDSFSIFLWDNTDCKIEEIEDFVKDATRVDLKSGIGIAGRRRSAWIDDRSLSPDGVASSRYYHDLLITATGLYNRLVIPRFGIDMPDANRRLIHIENLDAYFILALAETASFNEVGVLRQAIWNHLAKQTSLQIKIPLKFGIFEMGFHLAYFSLMTRPADQVESTRGPTNKAFQRHWIDLSFLLNTGDSQGEEVYGVYESNVGFVCCGHDNQRWTGYSFVDVHPDSGEEELSELISPEKGLHHDPISDGMLPADNPMWDPREYFLKIYNIRIVQVLEAWEPLVRKTEIRIKIYQRKNPSTLSKDSPNGDHQAEDVKRTFDWNQQTMVVLNQLLDVLCQTIDSWEAFILPTGDIRYFDDIDTAPGMPNAGILLSLHTIKAAVETMKVHRGTLRRLEHSCNKSAEALQLRLTLEANEAVRSNGLFTQFTMSYISPVMVAIAYYSIPQNSVPFKLEAKYFTPAIIFIGGLVQLLFMVFSTKWWSWWKTGKAWVKRIQPDFGKYRDGWGRKRMKDDDEAVGERETEREAERERGAGAV